MRLALYCAISILPLFIASFSESFFFKHLAGFKLNWQLKGFSYFDPEGTWGGEEVEGKITFDVKEDESREIRSSLSLHKGQFLYDKWYFNWEETPLSLDVHGSLRENTFFLQDGDLRLAQDTTLSIKGKIDLEKKTFCLDKGSLNIEDAAKAYSLLCKQPLQAIYPILEKIGITGKLRVEAEQLCLPEARGQLWTSFEGDISLPNVHIDDLKFHLPLVHTIPDEERGFIRIRRLLLHNEEFNDIYVPLSVKSGQMHLTEALHLAFAQGRASLLSLEGTSYPFFLKGTLALENIGLPSLPVLSNLRSEIVHFELTPDYARVDGNILISALGGEMTISNIRIEQIFSRFPKIRADIAFKNIDLSQISQYFSFGEMSGIINGHIKDLRIAYGQPESFELLIESGHQKGKRQMISLAAVNNISVLAQGSPVMVSWLLPKTFPYQKIGIKCSLKNDYFIIHGLMKHGDREYLIKKRLLGIDVVNRSPGQRVAFKEMIDRFKQISERDGT
jgi:hypothetical protein